MTYADLIAKKTDYIRTIKDLDIGSEKSKYVLDKAIKAEIKIHNDMMVNIGQTTQYKNIYIAYWKDIDEFGQGKDEEDAVSSLKRKIIFVYENCKRWLQTEAGLGIKQTLWFSTLSEHIAEVN